MAGLKRRVFLSYQGGGLGALGGLGLVEDLFKAEVLANKNPPQVDDGCGGSSFISCFASGLLREWLASRMA